MTLLARGPRRHVRGELLLAFCLLAAAVAALTYPQVRHLDRGVANHTDSYFNIWRLAWVAHQLPRDPLHLFDANTFYPERLTLALSDAILVPGLIAAPLFWLGAPGVVIYNVLLLATLAFSGLAMFVLMRRLTNRFGPSLFAGLVFALAPFRLDHWGHLELQVSLWMPLALWALDRTIEGGRLRDGVLTGLFVALQALSCLYYGIFFVTYLALIGPLMMLTGSAISRKPALKALIAGSCIAAVLVLPYIYPYLDVRDRLGSRAESEISDYSATADDFLAAPPSNILYGWTSGRFGGNERNLFPGIVVALLALVGICPPLSRLRLIHFVGLIFAIEMSLGLNGHLYELIYEYVAPYRGLRVPARFAMIVCLSLAILSGYGFQRLTSWFRGRTAQLAVGAIVFAIVAVEFRSSPDLMLISSRAALVENWLKRQRQTVIAEFPVTTPDRLDVNPDGLYMYGSIVHWQKLVNGYSGYYPPSYIQFLEAMRSFPDDGSLDYLRRRGVEYAVIRRRLYDPDKFGRTLDALQRRSDVTLVGIFPEPGGEAVVFRVLR